MVLKHGSNNVAERELVRGKLCNVFHDTLSSVAPTAVAGSVFFLSTGPCPRDEVPGRPWLWDLHL